MELSEKDKQALQQILEYETSTPPEKWQLGWSWDMVHIWPATLNRLLNMGLLEVVFHSNSYRGMKLMMEGRAMAQNLRQEAPETSEMLTQAMVCLPNDLFNDIIGHDEVKEMLVAALSALKPVHVLLAGPPALAKTLFLWDIERIYGESALWLLGSATSKAGLWDVIGERQPRVLLIDEIDRMSAVDAAGLLSLMEGGRLVRAKKGRAMDRTVPLWVVAATNHLERLSPELRSRFAIRKLKAYSQDEYHTVIKKVLVKREQVSPELANEIANMLNGRTQDVRDAVRVARLSLQLGVEKAIKLLLG